jgi:hypothetical protein
LNDLVTIEYLVEQGDWSLRALLKDRLRLLLHGFGKWRVAGGRVIAADLAANLRGRVLVTWRTASPRIDGLVLPVLGAIGLQRSCVLYQQDKVLSQVPPEAGTVRWSDIIATGGNEWARGYERNCPAWSKSIELACEKYKLPRGSACRMKLNLINSCKSVAGVLGFLKELCPSAIVTEYDRCSVWSCLILAARSLGIPTFTLQHGVLDEKSDGFVPILADKMFCWGELSREGLLRAGAKEDQLILGGCPRITREAVASDGIPISAADAKRKLGLQPAMPVVMLGTAPYRPTAEKAILELFCSAIERVPEAQGVVRLHPSQSPRSYDDFRQRFPKIRFCDNRDATVDEAMTAADIVVVQSSGLGSDALVKRRLTAVIDVPPEPLGHGRELIEQAGCPRLATPEEAAPTIRDMLYDTAYRERLSAARERYVVKFCAYFGSDSASRIASTVLAVVNQHLPKREA